MLVLGVATRGRESSICVCRGSGDRRQRVCRCGTAALAHVGKPCRDAYDVPFDPCNIDRATGGRCNFVNELSASVVM